MLLIMNIRLSLSFDLLSAILDLILLSTSLSLTLCVCVCVCVMQLCVGHSSCTSARTTCLMGGILRTGKMTVPILSTFMDAANWRERERHSDTVQVVVCLMWLSITMCLHFTCLFFSQLFPVFLSDCLSPALIL